MPKYKLPNAVTFREVLSIGKFRQYVRPQVDREDLAFLQYTGGTTGVAKGRYADSWQYYYQYFPSEVDCRAILLAIMLSNALPYWLYRFIMFLP